MTPKQHTDAIERLLKAHQAIIDAWFANWLQQERARIDDAFARRVNR